MRRVASQPAAHRCDCADCVGCDQTAWQTSALSEIIGVAVVITMKGLSEEAAAATAIKDRAAQYRRVLNQQRARKTTTVAV